MASAYYKPCRELERCDELIETYFKKGQYGPCFQGHKLALEKCEKLGIKESI